VSDDKIELRMRLMQKTENACKVTVTKNPKLMDASHRFWWIPRSLMGRTQTTADAGDDGSNFPFFTFTLPEWAIDQKQLWDYTST
jgi:hypothetical protein